jgi:hypothetical protein
MQKLFWSEKQGLLEELFGEGMPGIMQRSQAHDMQNMLINS